MYDQATREVLIVVWEASDRICGKRLRPLVPILVSAMKRYGHLRLAPEVLTMRVALPFASLGGDPTQRRGADLWRLERSTAWVHGGGSGCP